MGVRCPVSGVRKCAPRCDRYLRFAAVPDTGHRTPDTGHRTPDTGHRTPDTGRSDDGHGASLSSNGMTLASGARNSPSTTSFAAADSTRLRARHTRSLVAVTEDPTS